MGVADVPGAPGRVVSERSVPNPFFESTEIRYELADAGAVKLEVFDVRGARVRSLVAGQSMSAGEHVVRWDGRGAAGEPVPSGVYYCRLPVDGVENSGRVVVAR